MAKSFHPIFDIIDGASADFDKVVEASEKKILQETLSLIKGLETDAHGNIKTTISNLKKIGVIKTRLTKIANNKQFLAGVAKLIGAFDKIYNEQKKYFDSLSSNFVAHTNYHMGASSKFELMKSLAAQNVANNLTGAGLSANVTGKISDMLLRAVTTGAKYSDIVSEMHAYLLSTETSQGALSKYAKTYAVTALGQYTGQNNKLVTDDLGCEWFMYTGSTIETTREFCAHMTKKKYIHISEFADILAGKIDGHECAIYDKTGLPHGLIEGTTPENFLVNVGGWNCRHQLVPIAKEMVPAEIRAKFEKPKQPTKEEIEAQKKAEEEARIKAEQDKRNALIDKTAKNVLQAAKKYNDVDYSKLQKAMQEGNRNTIQQASREIAQAVAEMKRREQALTDLIPNARELHKTISIAELEQTHAGITKTLSRWDWDFNSPASLKAMKDGLEYEIKWMGREDRGKKRYPKTWQISQEAYKKRLELVEHRISMMSVKDSIKDQIAFAQHSRSPQLDTLLDKFDDLFADDNTSIAQLTSAANNLAKKVAQLEAQKSRRDAKKVKTKIASDFAPKTAAETKKDFVDYMKSIGHMIDERDVVVDNGFIHFQGDQHEYIYNAVKPETQAEQYQLWNHTQRGGGHNGRGGYVHTGNSFYINRAFRDSNVTGSIDSQNAYKLERAGLTTDDIKTIKLLDKKIAEFSLPIPIRVTRYVDAKALNSLFDTNAFTGSNIRQLYRQLQSVKGGTSLSKDPAYMSASTNEHINYFKDIRSVKLEIEVEPNTPIYITRNYEESEVVFGRSTELVFLSAKDDGRYLVLRCRMNK